MRTCRFQHLQPYLVLLLGFAVQAVVVQVLVTNIMVDRVHAEDEKGETGSGSLYVTITPSFILNYQARGAVRHLKTDVVIQVKGDHSVAAIENNIPLIQNALVLLISKQDYITVTTPAGRASMQEAALNEVLSVVQSEVPDVDIVEVLFTNFFVE